MRLNLTAFSVASRVLELGIAICNNYAPVNESDLVNAPLHFIVYVDISISGDILR